MVEGSSGKVLGDIPNTSGVHGAGIATILVAPDPRRQRQTPLFGDCQTQADGTCKILGIAPGEYHVYALLAGTEIDRRDANALQAFEKYGAAMKFA